MAVIPKYYKKEITDDLQVEGSAGKLKVALFNTNHPYGSAASQETYAGIIANECSGAGYSAGGVLLTGTDSSYSGDNTKFTADPTIFSNVTVSAMYAVVYNTDTGLIRGQYSLGVIRNVTAGTLTLTWNAQGLQAVV